MPLHTGVCTDVIIRASDVRRGDRHLVVHNIGGGAQMEDVLFAYEVTGHFRW